MTQRVGAAVEARARTALGAEPFERALRAGREWTLEEATAYALGSAPRRPVAAKDPHPTDALTTREQEIARFVARGLTNRQIATELVISARTVDTHVEHILTKLGYRSRAQIAGWVSDHAGE